MSYECVLKCGKSCTPSDTISKTKWNSLRENYLATGTGVVRVTTVDRITPKQSNHRVLIEMTCSDDGLET